MNLRDHAAASRGKTDIDSLILGSPAGKPGKAAGGRQGALHLLLQPDIASMGRRNRLSNATFYIFAAAGGSGASVIAAVLAFWALISLAIGRFPAGVARGDYPVVLSSLAFFLVMATSDLARGELGGALLSIAALLPFVMPLFLVQRMRLSRFADTLPPAFLGAAVGGLLLIPIVIAEYWFVSIRVQGFSGNPGPLSVTGMLCAGWSILHFQRDRSRWHLALAFVGAVGGSLAVVLSGMRGAWPLLPLCVAIALFAQRREIVAVWRQATIPARMVILSGVTLVGAAIVVLAMPAVFVRIDQMWSDLGLIAANADAPTSLNLRRGMYDAAIQAIRARPWFGYGGDHHWEAIAPYLNRGTFGSIIFSHFHNVVLTVGVDAGLIGVAALLAMVGAPVWTAWHARRSFGGGRRLAAALILVVAFFGAGMTNIMLFHDILDAVWVFSISLIAASVPARVGLGALAPSEG